MYSGVTATDCLRYLNRRLGVLRQEIELTEEEIMNVVFKESLITYSKFFPYYYRLGITAEDSIGGGYSNTYRIPNDDRLEIFNVHKVYLDNMNQFGGSLLPVVNDPYTSQLLNDYLSSTITPTTFEFKSPNLVTIRPKIEKVGSAMLEIRAVHPRHLKTIGIEMRDEFYELCYYDVLISLYPLRHRFESFNTPYGTIQPFLEAVDSAESNRSQLLESWKEKMLLQSNIKRLWIA